MTDRARARLAAVLAAGSVALVALIGVDASVRRRASKRDDAAVLAVAARLPSTDLALSGGARWLRMPSIEEPSAAFDLGPAMLDPDPAGGIMAPPREAWIQESSPRALVFIQKGPPGSR
jgi:hypothetical protein